MAKQSRIDWMMVEGFESRGDFDNIPGLNYGLEADTVLDNSFAPTGSTVTATNFTNRFELLLPPDLEFIRAVRTE